MLLGVICKIFLFNTSSFVFTKGVGKETLTANFEFVPDTPDEPADLNQNVKHWLHIEAEEGVSSISQSGRYKAGTSVTVSATALPNFAFAGWYDADGNLLTDIDSYTMTMPAENVVLTAKFDFVPASPDEPSRIPNWHILTLAAEEGGRVEADTYRLEEGESTTIVARPNTGFEFDGWYRNGVLYTESPEFEYVMGASNVTFEAHFSFNPDTPAEPDKIVEKKYAFYMMNVINTPGTTVQFPVYLTTREEATDMTFQLTFPNNLLPDMETLALSDATEGYSVDYEAGEAGEGRTAYVITMTANGNSIAVGNTAILTFSIAIPEDTETAKSYPVTINQVSVSDIEGNSQHAGTKNGRISVYKRGDVNGDDAVNVGDIVTLMSHIVGDPTDTFIDEIANVNEDESGDINVGDVVSIMNLITESEE